MKTKLWIVLLCFVPSVGHAQLVLSEVLYQPRSGEAEYIELHNRGT